MTRRPFFVAIATILALGLLMGLAYGAGRSAGMPATETQHTRYQQRGTTNVMPGSFTHHRRETHRGMGFGVAFRSQTRGWMHDWLRDHCCDQRHAGRAGYGRHSSRQGSTTGTAGFRNGPIAYSGDRHQTSGTHRSYGSHAHGGHHDGGWHHDCW